MSETLRNVMCAGSRSKIATHTEIFPIWPAQVSTRELPTVPCHYFNTEAVSLYARFHPYVYPSMVNSQQHLSLQHRKRLPRAVLVYINCTSTFRRYKRDYLSKRETHSVDETPNKKKQRRIGQKKNGTRKDQKKPEACPRVPPPLKPEPAPPADSSQTS
jgi:hypothetical protein